MGVGKGCVCMCVRLVWVGVGGWVVVACVRAWQGALGVYIYIYICGCVRDIYIYNIYPYINMIVKRMSAHVLIFELFPTVTRVVCVIYANMLVQTLMHKFSIICGSCADIVCITRA